MFYFLVTSSLSCILVVLERFLTLPMFALSWFLGSSCSGLISWLGKTREFTSLVLSERFLNPFLDLTMPMFPLSWFLGSHYSAFISFSSLFHGLLMNLDMKKIGIVENVVEKDYVSLLDLPDLVLECILLRLPPEGLYSMAGVSRSLRERCVSDYLWKKHMEQKWGVLVGPAAERKWVSYIASQKEVAILESKIRKRSSSFFENMFKTRSRVDDNIHQSQSQGCLPVDSIMAWYLSLETGRFWFPAQVYNRENGHVGFLLSCYDAEVCYEFQTDSFRARFSAHGGLSIEENIERNRLRKPAIDAISDLLHVSSCLTSLKPDDHIEIQWRRSKEFPYGWWYGVVGHLESCNRDAAYCICHSNETVVLEFTQYSPGSRWRRVAIDRKEHGEVGNETDGFYGGIRKVGREEEISKWKSLWPKSNLE